MWYNDHFGDLKDDETFRIIDLFEDGPRDQFVTGSDWDVPIDDLLRQGGTWFAKSFTLQLRHRGPLAPGGRRALDSGGWGRFDSYLDFVNFRTRHCFTVGQALRIFAADRKLRVQVAAKCKISPDGSVDPKEIALVRAVSGHSFDDLDLERIYQRVSPEAATRKHESVVAHQTKYEHFANVMRKGLVPGMAMTGCEGVGKDGRPLIYMSPFLPEDQRNVVGGRHKPGYDTTVVFDFPELVAKAEGAIWIAANGTILADVDCLPMTLFQSVYRVEQRGHITLADALPSVLFSRCVVGSISRACFGDPVSGRRTAVRRWSEERAYYSLSQYEEMTGQTVLRFRAAPVVRRSARRGPLDV